MSQPLSPLTVISEIHRAGLFSLPDTELALLGFHPTSLQEEWPSGSTSMSVFTHMLRSVAVHDSLP